jgi:hypothetical protein
MVSELQQERQLDCGSTSRRRPLALSYRESCSGIAQKLGNNLAGLLTALGGDAL